MTKKKKILLVGIILLIITLSFIGGQVFSKYLTQVKGEGTANIASWNFKVNEQEEQIQTIHLLGNSKDKNLANGKIAPGSTGEFSIQIDGTGTEVGIDYKVIFQNEKNKPSHLKFNYQGKEYNSITEIEDILNGSIYVDEEEKTRKINIQWYWAYETGRSQEEIEKNDQIDTKEAKEIENYTFDVAVVGTQIMP